MRVGGRGRGRGTRRERGLHFPFLREEGRGDPNPELGFGIGGPVPRDSKGAGPRQPGSGRAIGRFLQKICRFVGRDSFGPQLGRLPPAWHMTGILMKLFTWFLVEVDPVKFLTNPKRAPFVHIVL